MSQTVQAFAMARMLEEQDRNFLAWEAAEELHFLALLDEEALTVRCPLVLGNADGIAVEVVS